MRKQVSYCLVFLVCFLSLNLVACGKKVTPENEVRQYIAKAETAAEARDVIAISELVSDNYRDNDGRDRRALAGIATAYFLRHKHIHLFIRVKQIDFPTPKQATVQLYAAMTGTPVKGAQALIDIHADLYRFDLLLVKEEDDWLLSKADWQPANIEDLLQE
jgi:hypothetical protein